MDNTTNTGKSLYSLECIVCGTLVFFNTKEAHDIRLQEWPICDEECEASIWFQEQQEQQERRSTGTQEPGAGAGAAAAVAAAATAAAAATQAQEQQRQQQ